jgi:hypothetical protein
MDELQEMREQLAALKEKLNKQEIVNEKNLRKLMFKKALRFKVFMWVGILLIATPTVVLWIMNFVWFDGTHIDLELILVTLTTTIMLTMLVIGTSIIKLRDIRSGNLRTVKEQIRKMSTPINAGKKERIVYRVFLILVITQFMVNRYDNGMFEFTMLDKVLFACLILVALLDLCFPEWRVKCGEWIRKKIGRKKRTTEWDEYVRQIEEMTEDDEENDDEEKGL